MDTFFLREIFLIVKYFLIGAFSLFLLNALKELIFTLLNKKSENTEDFLKRIENKLDLIISSNNQRKNADNISDEDFFKSKKENSFVYNDNKEEEKIKKTEEEIGKTYKAPQLYESIQLDIPTEVFQNNIEEEREEIFQENESRQWIDSYEEYLKEDKKRLEKVSHKETFSFDDFYKMYHRYTEKIEIPIQEGYFHITELCAVEMENLKDRTKYAICKGVRKTNEKIKLIKKNLKTDEILLEHEFDVYETSDKHIYKKFIVYHSISDDKRRIRFFGERKEGYRNVEIDENTKEPYVFIIHRNKYGNISVVKNHQYYEKYAQKIEEKSGTENLF